MAEKKAKKTKKSKNLERKEELDRLIWACISTEEATGEDILALIEQGPSEAGIDAVIDHFLEKDLSEELEELVKLGASEKLIMECFIKKGDYISAQKLVFLRKDKLTINEKNRIVMNLCEKANIQESIEAAKNLSNRRLNINEIVVLTKAIRAI